MHTSKNQKSKSSNSHTSKSFFNKSGEGSSISESKETNKPFFSAYPIQAKMTTRKMSENGKCRTKNKSGMPDSLKVGLEQLSGMDLSRVRVHKNSSKPAQLNALAYTQGQDIHLGPGQEKHLPHEGWHVVQQMQGRVQPTLKAKGVSINDDTGLEREADVMGGYALRMKPAVTNSIESEQARSTSIHPVIQAKENKELGEQKLDDKIVFRLFDRISDVLAYAPSPPIWIDLPGTGPTPNMAGIPGNYRQVLWDFWVASNGTDENGRVIKGVVRRERVKRGWAKIQVLLKYARNEYIRDADSDFIEEFNEFLLESVHLKVAHIETLAAIEISDKRNEILKAASIERSIPTIEPGWKLLGTTSGKMGAIQSFTSYLVGTEEQWLKVLKRADDLDIYNKYLDGFLRLANNPNLARKTSASGWTQYKNTIKRAITHDEIMAFMRALYNTQNLKIREGFFSSGGNMQHRKVTINLAKIIRKYQGALLRELSIRGGKGGSRVINEKVIRAVAEEGRDWTREEMIGSAIVSANEALANLVIAEAQNNEVKKSNAYQLISNAGSLIRHTLDVHKEALIQRHKMNMLVLDLVLDITKLDEIPGVQTILRRVPSLKGLLKNNAINMYSAGSGGNEPYTQAYRIAAKFEDSVNELGPAGNAEKLGLLLRANSERIAINSFKSGMSVK